MNKKILISSLLIIAVIVVVIFTQIQSQEDKPVKIGILQSWILEGPFYVAEEQGFYEEEGINAEIVELGSVDEFVPAIVSKDILVAETIADMFIVQSTQELNIRQIMRKATLHGLDGIVTTDDVNSAQDLRGKEIAVQTISPSHYLLLNYLRDGGVSSDDVTLLPTEAGNAGAAFLTEKVDVAVTWEPWLSRASERERGKILFSTKDSPELIYDILITRGDLTEQEQEDVRAIMRAWYKALAWMNENPEETIEIFSRRLGLPKEEVEFFFTKLDFMNYEDNLQFYGTKDNLGPVEAYTNKAAQIWQEENIIKQKPDPNVIIEPNYLNELYK